MPRLPPRTPTTRRFRWALAGIGLVGLAVRWLTVALYYRKLSPQPPGLEDNTFYWLQSNLLARGKGYANPFIWLRAVSPESFAAAPPTVDLDRLAQVSTDAAAVQHSAAKVPGYTTYLALVHLMGFHSPLAMRLASGLLGALCVVGVGWLAMRVVGSERAGLLAAGMAAVYPNLWINDGLILSESLAALAVVGVLLAAYTFIERPDRRRAALLGLAVGACCLVRGEAQLYFLLLIPPLALWSCRRLPWTRRIALAALAGAVGLAVVTPWVATNLSSFKYPVFLSIGAGFVLDVSNCDATYHGDLLGYTDFNCRQSRPIDAADIDGDIAACGLVQAGTTEADARRALQERQWPSTADESQVECLLRRDATRYIDAHRTRLVGVVIPARVARIWNLYRPLQGVDLDTVLERRGRLPSQLGLAGYYAFGALAAVGAWSMWRRRYALLPMAVVVGAVTVTVASTMAITRYRVPAEVVWVVLAGVGVDHLWRRWRREDGNDGVVPSPGAGASAGSAGGTAGGRGGAAAAEGADDAAIDAAVDGVSDRTTPVRRAAGRRGHRHTGHRLPGPAGAPA